jgi:hypothetical protein
MSGNIYGESFELRVAGKATLNFQAALLLFQRGVIQPSADFSFVEIDKAECLRFDHHQL